MPVTILDIAKARGLKVDKDGGSTMPDFFEVGLGMLGGCERCESSIAAYNAYPSITGFWRCKDCIADLGYKTVEDFEANSK
jgi:hypothetical protein